MIYKIVKKRILEFKYILPHFCLKTCKKLIIKMYDWFNHQSRNPVDTQLFLGSKEYNIIKNNIVYYFVIQCSCLLFYFSKKKIYLECIIIKSNFVSRVSD